MMIIVWKNPTAIFILIGACTTEQSQVKHELLFCARILLGNIRRIFLLKNLGYWNAYYYGLLVVHHHIDITYQQYNPFVDLSGEIPARIQQC